MVNWNIHVERFQVRGGGRGGGRFKRDTEEYWGERNSLNMLGVSQARGQIQHSWYGLQGQFRAQHQRETPQHGTERYRAQVAEWDWGRFHSVSLQARQEPGERLGKRMCDQYSLGHK